MDADKIRELLEQVSTGGVAVDQAMERLKHMPFEDLGFAKVDHHRALRHGIPEVVFGKGKTPEQVSAIVNALLTRAQNVLVTRATPETALRLLDEIPDAEHFPASGAVRVWRDRSPQGKGKIAIACAGTSDLPVAEEARVTAETMGNEVDAIHDIGVAGIHRLMAHRERLAAARVVIVCAGMEGALPSVIGGLVAAPVIAVPTSIGYGASCAVFFLIGVLAVSNSTALAAQYSPSAFVNGLLALPVGALALAVLAVDEQPVEAADGGNLRDFHGARVAQREAQRERHRQPTRGAGHRTHGVHPSSSSRRPRCGPASHASSGASRTSCGSSSMGTDENASSTRGSRARFPGVNGRQKKWPGRSVALMA